MGEVNLTLVEGAICPCDYCQRMRSGGPVYQDAVCWFKLGCEIKVQNTEICERDDALRRVAEVLGSTHSFMTWEQKVAEILDAIQPFLPSDAM